jgi:hypothetical protein
MWRFVIIALCLSNVLFSCNSDKNENNDFDSSEIITEKSKMDSIKDGCKQYVVNDISDFSLDNVISLGMMDRYASDFSTEIFYDTTELNNVQIDSIFVYKNTKDTIFFYKNENLNCILHCRISFNSNIFKEIFLDHDLNQFYLKYITNFKCFSVANVEATQFMHFYSDLSGKSYIMFESPYLYTQINWDDFIQLEASESIKKD